MPKDLRNIEHNPIGEYKVPDSTLSLIGRAVKNIQNSTDVFFANRKYCMWADNVLEQCDNEENPTVFCDPENCPLGEE